MAGTSGSHAGSFAGGFIKSFLAMMQMSLRYRQQKNMDAFYGVMMQQMRMNMKKTQGDLDMQQRFKGGAWGGKSYNDTFGSGGDIDKFKNNIDKIEGAKPDTVTPVTHADGTKDEALGTHQILASNLADWGKQYGGIDGLTKDHFLSDSELQDKIFDGKLRDDVSKYGFQNAASRYFTGRDYDQASAAGAHDRGTTVDNYVKRAMEGIGPQASAIDSRDSGEAKSFLSSVSNHADRPGDTSNMNPEFATRLASAIKQANAEGIPARLESGYRDPDELWNRGDRSKAAYFDAEGLSKHSDGRAGDIAGIGTAGSPTAQRWAEIANANGLSVPYGYDNGKEFNHTELAGLTPNRGAQPVNASRSMVAGPGAPSTEPQPAPPTTLKPDQFQTGGPELAAATAPVPPVTAPTPALGGGPGNALEVPTGTPAPTPAAQPAAIPTRGAAPGTLQYDVGGVRGQRPGQGPIYTAAGPQQPVIQQAQPIPQQAQPAQPAAIPDRAGALASAPTPPPDPRQGLRPQQVPPDQTPMPPPRPQDLSGVETSPSGDVTPTASPSSAGGSSVGQAGGLSDPLWAGYSGASPDQAASADPLQNLYASNQESNASAGLTDTTGLMAAGAMSDVSSAEEPDLTAEMYRGGPVVRYYRGGVIKRYAAGGDTDDDDLLSEYGGTDTEDPMANSMWDQRRVADLTNNSDPSSTPDLTTSIQNRAMAGAQDQPLSGPPPLEEPNLSASAGAPTPTDQPPAASTDQPAAPTEQTPSEQTPPDQSTSQSDIPPGSVQVAGPGGWGSVRSEINIPLPRVGGSMSGGMRGPRPSMSSVMRGAKEPTGLGHQPLYTPQDEDYNHLGLAPVTNSDGNPSVWLMNMVDNGVRALFQGFGFANQGAMPGSPEQAQNLQNFGSHPGVTKEDMDNLGDFIDPKHQLYEGGRDIAGAVGMIKYYAITGQLDAASRLSGGVLLYTRMMSMQYGDEAVKSLFNGDYKNAVKSLEKGYNWYPDGKTAEATDIDPKTGKVHAVQKDGNGNVISEQDYLPAAIMKAALGLKDGTGFWNMLSGIARAGGNDALGSHYETQKMLRQIQGNETVPPPPLALKPPAAIGGPSPDGSQAPAPDGSQAPTPVVAPPAPDGSQPPAAPTPDGSQPPAAPAPAPSDGSVQTAPPPTAIPSAGGPNANVGQAAPPPAQAQPPQAMASRSDGVPPNLVAGPAVPTTLQPQPAQPSESGNVLVAQQKAREEQAQQTSAVQRMMQGGAYDPDDPYIQQKIADIDKQNLAPLRQYRTQLEQQYAAIEGADISPAEKKQLQVALAAKIKNFDETSWRPAVNDAKLRISQISSSINRQFNLQKTIAVNKQKEIDKQNDQMRTYDNQRVGAIQKREAALPAGHPQLNADAGQEADGKPMVNPVTGDIIKGYGEQLEGNLSDKSATDASAYANPITRYAVRGNPWLSSSTNFDPKTGQVDPTTFDPSKIPNTIFTPMDRKTMAMSSRDMIMYNSGDLDFRTAQDLTTGVSTGAYAISEPQDHPKIHSMVLGDLPNDDGVPRSDVYIRRGMNDDNPMKVTMSTANAKRLFELSQKTDAVSIHNRTMADIHAPAGLSYPSSPSASGNPPSPSPISPRSPRTATKADASLPPRPAPQPLPNAPPYSDRVSPSFKLGSNGQIVPVDPKDITITPRGSPPIPPKSVTLSQPEVPAWIIGPNGQVVPNPNYR